MGLNPPSVKIVVTHHATTLGRDVQYATSTSPMLIVSPQSANDIGDRGHLRKPEKVDYHQCQITQVSQRHASPIWSERWHAWLIGQVHAEEVACCIRTHIEHQVSGLRSRLVGGGKEGRYSANECSVSPAEVIVIDVAL